MSFGHDKLNRAGIYDPALAAAGQNPFLIPEAVNLGGFTGTPGVRNCALERCRDDNNFAPRVGFAWDVKRRPEDSSARRLRYLLPAPVQPEHPAKLAGRAVHGAAARESCGSDDAATGESACGTAATVDRCDRIHSHSHFFAGLRRSRAARAPLGHQRSWRWPDLRQRRGSAVSQLWRHRHQLLDQPGVVYQRATRCLHAVHATMELYRSAST